MERLEDRSMLSAGPPKIADLHIAGTNWTSAFVTYLQTHNLGDLGYRIPVGTAAQAKSLPWLNIDLIIVSFSEDVDVQAADLSLSGVNATSFSLADFSYEITHDVNGSTFIATWTFANPLPKNVYQIDLDGDGLDPVADVDGNALDGEWTNNSDTMPSGNGSAGGDFAFTFKVMPGDGNQNNGVELADYYAASSRQGATTASSNYNPLVDIDGDGLHEVADTQAVQAKLWSTYPSGTPVGASNDAPTTSGIDSVPITNAAIDVAISLWNAFADAETADHQLTYQVVSNTNPTLFDAVSINSTTGNLTLNAASGASGRSEITVRATDAAGLSVTTTFAANINSTTVNPYLTYVVIPEGYNAFRFVGEVSDDQPVEGLLVVFTGALSLRASVQADGSFEFVVVLDEEDEGGSVWGVVLDGDGLSSNSVLGTIVVT